MPARAHATIVVVEDNIDLNHAIVALLEAAGYRHRSYTSAEAFLASEPPLPPCCVISDYRLPGLNGLELYSRLAQRVPHIPVLLLSAYMHAADIRQALRHGVYAFMHKPFDPDELLARTQQAVDASGP